MLLKWRLSRIDLLAYSDWSFVVRCRHVPADAVTLRQRAGAMGCVANGGGDPARLEAGPSGGLREVRGRRRGHPGRRHGALPPHQASRGRCPRQRKSSGEATVPPPPSTHTHKSTRKVLFADAGLAVRPVLPLRAVRGALRRPQPPLHGLAARGLAQERRARAAPQDLGRGCDHARRPAASAA